QVKDRARRRTVSHAHQHGGIGAVACHLLDDERAFENAQTEATIRLWNEGPSEALLSKQPHVFHGWAALAIRPGGAFSKAIADMARGITQDQLPIVENFVGAHGSVSASAAATDRA